MSQSITVIEDNESAIGSMVTHAATSQAIQMMGAILDKRISTARSFPRRVSKFKSEAIALLQEDVETARSAEYAKPVGNGTVRGASVRLAELAALCWGNLEITFEEPIVGEKSVTVVCRAWDLERNYSAPGIATMSILNKHGHRYAQHMVDTTVNATASKARRNAILSIIPKAYITDLLAAAKKVANANEPPLEERRKTMIEHFARTFRITQEQILGHLDVKGVDDITPDHLDEMRGILNAIKEGEPVEAFFHTKTESTADKVKAKIASRKAANAPKPEEKPKDEPSAGEPTGGALFDNPSAKSATDALKH